MFRFCLALAILVGAWSLGAECPSTATHSLNRFQVGLQLESLLPNRLPSFDVGLPLYGLTIGIPVFTELLILEGEYGNQSDFSLHRFEVGLRHIFQTPYFNTFLQVTAFRLRYSLPGVSYTHYGPAFTAGMALPMDQAFTIQFFAKLTKAERALFGVGGGFTVSFF